MTSCQPIVQPVARMMNSLLRRQRLLFVPSRVIPDQQPIQHGKERLSLGCSNIVRAGAARLIPMPWNWIFLPMLRTLLALTPTMTAYLLRPSVSTKS